MALQLIENYVYLVHIDKFYILPTYPESITDTKSANFQATSPLFRTSPIQTYTGSGPRALNVVLDLHRDMMNAFNVTNESLRVAGMDVEIGDDYVDMLVKDLQAITLPKFSNSERMVKPPQVIIRFGNDIYIQGVVSGLNTTLSGAIMDDNKYSEIGINFSVTEVTPFDADTIRQVGMFAETGTLLRRTLESPRWS